MRIAIVVDIFAFKHASGIFTWILHTVRLGQRIGFSVDLIVPAPYKNFMRNHTLSETYKYLTENYPIDVHFTEGENPLDCSANMFEQYLKHKRPTIFVNCNAEDMKYGPWDTHGVPLIMYQHTGAHVYENRNIIESALSIQPDALSFVITEQAVDILKEDDIPAIYVPQPFYPTYIPDNTVVKQNRAIIISGGYAFKRDNLAIMLCAANNIDFVGYGGRREFEHVSNDRVVRELAQSQALVHMSMSEMLPYNILEASLSCNTVVDMRMEWVKPLKDKLNIIPIDPLSADAFKWAFEQPKLDTFKLKQWQEECECVWRETLSSLSDSVL